MSFFGKLASIFGMGAIDEELEDSPSAVVSPAQQKAENAQPKPAHERPLAVDKEQADAIFEKVVEMFNASLPGFLAKSVDPEKEKKCLYDALDASMREYLESLRGLADENAKAAWQAEHDRLLAESEALKKKASDLEGAKSDIKDKQLSAERQRRALSERVRDLEEQVLKLEAEKEQYEIENKCMVNKAKASAVLEAEIEDLRAQMAQSGATGASAVELHDANAKIKALEENRLHLQQTIAGLEDGNKELDKKAAELEGANADLTEKFSSIEKENTQLAEKLSRLEKENQGLREQVDGLSQGAKVKDEVGDAMINELQTKAAEANANLASLQRKLDEGNEAIELANAKLEDAKRLADEREAMCRMLKAEAEEKESKIKELEEEVDDLKSQMADDEETQREMEEIQKQIDLFEQVKTKMDARIEKLKASLQASQKENESLRDTIRENLIEHARVQKELNQRIAELDSEVNHRTGSIPIDFEDAPSHPLADADWLMPAPAEDVSMRVEDPADFGYKPPKLKPKIEVENHPSLFD